MALPEEFVKMWGQELVEKWERSGLLEQVKNKESMAFLMEAAARKLLEFAKDNKDEKGTAIVASLVFPTLQRAFRDREYDVKLEATPISHTISIFVNTSKLYLGVEDDNAPDLVAECAESLGRLLTEYESVSTTVSSIDVQPRGTGFHLLVHLL